jgi:hypothetical protein
MLPVLNKLLVRSFYKANAGFFLFFFFVFFGAVEGNSLVSYHLSLMKSILSSTTILLLVIVCWLLYHIKCTVFFLKIVNSEEGKFLVNLQAVQNERQWLFYIGLYVSVYAPVLLYSFFVVYIGIQKGYVIPAISILLFQVFSLGFFTGILHYRINHWMETIQFPSIRLPFRKSRSLVVLFYFTHKRKNLLLILKAFSLTLLYIILLWNKGKYDNDSFMLFYLVLLLAHAVIPYFAVQFLEKEFAVYRNLPISLLQRGLAFLLPFCILLLPDVAYLLLNADAFSFMQQLAYSINLLASLSLLTAIQYSEAQSAEEYMKATFALVFLSIFILHVQAFWFWIIVQFTIASILFVSGYYKFERKEE